MNRRSLKTGVSCLKIIVEPRHMVSQFPSGCWRKKWSGNIKSVQESAKHLFHSRASKMKTWVVKYERAFCNEPHNFEPWSCARSSDLSPTEHVKGIIGRQPQNHPQPVLTQQVQQA
ncbi:hypothetical protein TNCV_430801 [Trichonephila clavipes]|nr:hypothetical protein TNCV_430801 [Trichonephila clavipes]